jgi:hypothetical protein
LFARQYNFADCAARFRHRSSVLVPEQSSFDRRINIKQPKATDAATRADREELAADIDLESVGRFR